MLIYITQTVCKLFALHIESRSGCELILCVELRFCSDLSHCKASVCLRGLDIIVVMQNRAEREREREREREKLLIEA